jgi:hypothetical protein
MHYPHNAIFDRGLLNTFEAASHLAYLCLKVSASLGVISIHNNKRDAKNIEQGFTRGQQDTSTPKAEAGSGGKITIEAECDTKRATLDLRVPDKTVLIAQDLSPEEEAELLSFLDKNNDVFAWATSDLTGLSRSIIKHKLQVNPSAKPIK